MKLISTLFLLIAYSAITAQTKYVDEAFNVNVHKDVTYGQNYEFLSGTANLIDLKMDVYYPKNDLESDRPLILFLHAGSFLPADYNFMPYGNKEDSCLVELCSRFAKRGYVAASVNYRTGWQPLAADQEVKASSLIQAVYRSMHDAKTAVRWFKKNQDLEGTYKIDTDKIIVAGDNSGAITAITYATLDKFNEIVLPKFLWTTTGQPYVDPALMGEIDGSGGDAAWNNYQWSGYSNDVHMVLNLGGSVGDSSWLETGDIPIVSFHGLADPVYGTSIVTVGATGDPIIEVSGSGDLMARSTRLGNQDVILNSTLNFNDPFTSSASNFTTSELAEAGLFPWAGADNSFDPFAWYDPNHPNVDNSTPGATGYGSSSNPFATPQKAKTYIDTIMAYFVPRSVVVLDLDTSQAQVSVLDLNENSQVSIYPNPVKKGDQVMINLDETNAHLSIEVLTLKGEVVQTINPSISNTPSIQTTEFSPGLYFLKLNTSLGKTYKKLVIY